MKILLLDNYDSFTWNLVHTISRVSDCKVSVFKNDEIQPEQASAFDKIILSPGPGLPEEAGIMIPLIKEFASTKPILGVCLGHQAIAQAFGGSLFNLDQIYHGVATPVYTDDSRGKISTSYIFSRLPSVFETGRYHSWMVNESELPSILEVTARDEEGRIMAMQHKDFDVQGIQFHPESVLTEHGYTMMANWIRH